jgi:hypothetical protein
MSGQSQSSLQSDLSMFDLINFVLGPGSTSQSSRDIYIGFTSFGDDADDYDGDDYYMEDPSPCDTKGMGEGMGMGVSSMGSMGFSPMLRSAPSTRVLHPAVKPKPGPKAGPKSKPRPTEHKKFSHSESGSEDSTSGSSESSEGGWWGSTDPEGELGTPSRYFNTLQAAAPEDMPYGSYLGFGQAGDQCLMNSYEELSYPCQNALDDAVGLREEYIAEDQGCPFHGPFVLIGLVMLVLACVCRFRKKRMMKQRKQEVSATLKAIHGE